MIPTVSRPELERLVEAGSVVLVDALPASYYDRMHLPGAVNVVESAVDELAPVLLPDKTAAIVTYCSNSACGNSRAVATRLESLGYTGVRTYPDGIQDWTEAGNGVESSAIA